MTGAVVALATCAKVADLTADDALLIPALAAEGVRAAPAVWDDPSVDWTAFDAVVIRSCWDYHHQPRRFLDWVAAREAAGTPLWNPAPVLRWNADKRYLRELAARGVRTVPTRWLEAGADASLDAVLAESGWHDAVVKPVVSASATDTWRAARGAEPADEARFRALTETRAMMVQPMVREIERDGEWSFLFFGGTFSHAILKRPRAGDFRVQMEHGGVAEARTPPDALRDDAHDMLAAAGVDTVYARVDGCAIDGRLVLMELELLEPQLFLGWNANAPARLAGAIRTTLGRA